MATNNDKSRGPITKSARSIKEGNMNWPDWRRAFQHLAEKFGIDLDMDKQDPPWIRYRVINSMVDEAKEIPRGDIERDSGQMVRVYGQRESFLVQFESVAKTWGEAEDQLEKFNSFVESSKGILSRAGMVNMIYQGRVSDYDRMVAGSDNPTVANRYLVKLDNVRAVNMPKLTDVDLGVFTANKEIIDHVFHPEGDS